MKRQFSLHQIERLHLEEAIRRQKQANLQSVHQVQALRTRVAEKEALTKETSTVNKDLQTQLHAAEEQASHQAARSRKQATEMSNLRVSLLRILFRSVIVR